MDVSIIDTVVSAFTSALATGALLLAQASVLILGVAATIAFARTYAATLTHGTGGGDALADLLFFLVLVCGYQYAVLHMHDLRTLGLNAATTWGRQLGTGAADQAFDVTQPSTVMTLGGQVAFPMLSTDDRLGQAKAVAKLVIWSPDRWAGIIILLAFALVGVHLVLTVVEYYLAFGAAMVLVPWGVWNTSSSLAEGALGWLAGSFVRLFLTITMVGLGLGVFRTVLPAADWGFADLVTGARWWDVVVRVVAAWVFAVLCWTVPAKASNRMGGVALGLSGSTAAAGAMGTARMAMAIQSAGQVVNRGTSRMLARV